MKYRISSYSTYEHIPTVQCGFNVCLWCSDNVCPHGGAVVHNTDYLQSPGNIQKAFNVDEI